MSEIIFDECLQNLFYAQEAMKDWIPLSDYEMIFEAEDPEVKTKIFKNDVTATNSTGFIQKAINTVLSIINSVIDAIKNLITGLTMSGKEREEYERFKQMVAQDPKLKNKKVSISDFKTISANFDKLISEVDNEIRSVEADPNHPTDNIANKVNNFLSSTVTAGSTILATDVAIRVADSNIEMAKGIQAALNAEEGIMKELSKQLGKREAKKFKKKIDAAAKNTTLHQWKVKLLKRKYESLQDCIKATFGSFTGVGLGSWILKFLSNDNTKDATKSAIRAGVKGAKTVHDIKHQIEKDKKADEKQKKRAEREAAKSQKRAEKEAAKEAKYREKHPDDPSYKSAADFITGK